MFSPFQNPHNWININDKAVGAPPMSLISFIHWCLKGTLPVLTVAALASISLGVVETYIAALIGYIVDVLIESGANSLVANNWGLIIAVAVFLFFVRPTTFFISSYLQSMVLSPGLRTLVAIRLHRWTLGHAKSFFDNDFAGRIAQKEVQASNALADAIVEIIHTVLFAIATVAAAFWIISSVDWRVGLMVVFWFIGFHFMMGFFLPRIKSRSAHRANAQAAATGQIVDTVSNISIVKLFANSTREDNAAQKAFEVLKMSLCSYGWELIRFRTLMVLYASTLFFGVMVSCVYLWIGGSVTAGEVVVAGSVAMRMMMMAGWVSFSLMTIYTNLGDVEDAMKTLAVPHAMVDEQGALPIIVKNGKIDFQGVSYSYGREKGGLSNVSLSIKAGEKVGVVGASGAGKSTLVATLLRLHDPEKGSVLVDDTNISRVTQDSLRSQISMVTQETSMFNRTARENIIYGRPEATDEDVIDAAKRAGAHDFIISLVDNQGREGYEAFLGERGVKLSGGQRQRIALARAIIKNAPILVLDEATSALDSEVEAAIQEALRTVMEGKTVFAIAHRLSTISHMDRIVVMEEGRIVEIGTHHSLISKNGVYAGFWRRQSGGFLGVDTAA